MNTPDREAAAGLVERLNEEATYLSRHAWTNGNQDVAIASIVASEAATLITTLLSELERVGKELSEFRELYAREARKNIVIAESQSAAEARALKAEALVAEAVQVCEPFADVSDYLKSETEGLDDQDEFWIAVEDHQLYNIKVGSFRAARAFIDRAKES